MKAGDRVWYRQTCRGGYGFERWVPGWFVRDTVKRTVISLSSADKAAQTVTIAVHPKNVRPRR